MVTAAIQNPGLEMNSPGGCSIGVPTRRRCSVSRWAYAMVACLIPICWGSEKAQGTLVLTIGLTNSIQFVFFEGGEFLMGAPSTPPPLWKDLEDCLPAHKVWLSPFYFSKYPVSTAQFCEFLNRGVGRPEREEVVVRLENIGLRRDGLCAEVDRSKTYPAIGVSYGLAARYCEWLSKVTGRHCRLSTEAEWEFVASGGRLRRAYPWGEEQKEVDLWKEPLGVHPELATPEGVHDLNGPVYQWCADAWDPSFYARSPYKDPVRQGPADHCVIRGGPMMRMGYAELRYMRPVWLRAQASAKDARWTGMRLVIKVDRPGTSKGPNAVSEAPR